MDNYSRRKFIGKVAKVGFFIGTAASCATLLNACEGLLDTGTYAVMASKCTGTSICLSYCKFDAISIVNSKAVISEVKCTACGACASKCPANAIYYVSN